MKRPALSHLLGYTALIVIVTAGAAQSLPGSNTIFGDDIVDGTITTPDIKVGAISGSRLLDNGITSSKVYNNTLTGTDINELTLRLACPSGTTRDQTFCFTDLLEPQTLAVARTDCLTRGLRLPSSASEAALVAQVAGDGDGVFIWADGYIDADTVRVGGQAGFGETLDDNPTQYHCITTVGWSDTRPADVTGGP